ncbi:uncharacterized protein JCM10292_002225 [Rhodotorula paludigena]|uniref:uncharacterized protein n=1 Tax=Rhodotorula paludigena TaxID=86838 RepID=UPI003181BF8A
MTTATKPVNRLAGLPRIPKISKKSKQPKKPSSPAKPKPAPLPPAYTITLSDDDTLSEPESSDSSGDEQPTKGASSQAGPSSRKVEDVCLVCEGACRCGGAQAAPILFGGAGSLPALPALPSLPALPPLPPKPSASASTKAQAPAPAKPAAPAPPPAPPSASTSTAPKPSVTTKPRPRPRTGAPTSSAPKPPKPAASNAPGSGGGDSASYIPHHGGSSRSATPQRMSLRQVLALSLQEAEAQSAKSASETGGTSTRENSPDAMELSRAAMGERAKGKGKGKGKGKAADATAAGADRKGKGKERLSDVSDLELDEADDESELSSLTDDEDDEGDVAMAHGLEKEEERALRAELERKRRRRSAASDGNVRGHDDDATDEDDDLAGAWDRNVRAMERLHRRRESGGAGADISLDASFGQDEDEDSDLAVTDMPPGNGFGVVTWSDYEFDEDEEEEEEEEEDVLTAALAATEAEQPVAREPGTLAGQFEDELEQLFALSEAVVGPIRQGEHDLGDMWLEALSDLEEEDLSQLGSDGDEDGEDDIDAEMIFGPDGELKRLFGQRKKRRHSAVDSSAGESESDFDSSEATDEELELVRVGVALNGDERRKRPKHEGGADDDGDADDSTSAYDSENEQTDSSCSDTDIYRYAPRTGALSALQAPTTADLASLPADSSSAPAKPAAKAAKHKGKSKARLPAIPEAGPSTVSVAAATAARKPVARRRGPVLGSFEPSAPKEADESGTGVKVVVIDENGVSAPTPFAVPKKSKRRTYDSTPSRRSRANSRVSTTSGTSGAESAADIASNIGSPVLANVNLGFDFDSVLHESVLEGGAEDSGASSSDSDAEATATDGGATSATPKAASALSDFSRWSRIPIGAFRSRTMGASSTSAPSQVFHAKAAASEKGRRKKASKKASGSGAPIATSILRDYKAVASLNHTLGSPGQAASTSKRSITSRMLTSPVLAPVIRGSTSASAARSGAANLSGAAGKKTKRSKRSAPSGSVRSKSPAARSRSRQASLSGPLSAAVSAGGSAGATLTAPTANLPPLHSPLFRTVSMPEPSSFRLN